MIRTFFVFLILLFLFTVPGFGQETVTVIAIQANLRGTPDAKGISITNVIKGEQFELIKQADAWFLVQTPKYVGWLHGNTIELDQPKRSDYEYPRVKPTDPEIRIPRTTSKPTTETDAFEKKYVGGDVRPSITVINDANRKINLTFGGVRYIIDIASTLQLTVDGGNYEFSASAPGVRSISGVKAFDRGYSYSWSFYIVTR
jgi:hypothetical protein